RIGVADPAEEARVGERAFQRVVLAHERLAEALERGLERFRPPAVHLAHRLFAAHEMDGGALLARYLGEHDGARVEIESGEPDLAWDLRSGVEPSQPSRDHEVHDEEEVAFQLEDESLADAAQGEDFLAG